MPLLGWSLLVILAPGPKLLLVAGSEESPTARGLRALGVPYERTAPGDFRRVSPFDYDLLVLGMDEARAPLAAAAAPLAAFVRAGGVVLGFRATGDETWLPVPVRHGKAYHLGAVEQPAHPLFTTPHRLDPKLLADVHGGSIYGALHALGEGWRPLLGTGAEQEWDRSPAGEPGPRHGLAELPWGRGTIVLCQMIPAYHWFNDRQGEAGCAGAKLFENLVRYAMSKAGTRAAERPPRRVPDGFHRRWENVVAAPRRGDGARLDGDGWRFSSQGAWSRTIDRRGVLTFTHADQPSAAGGFAQLTGTLTPPADGRVVLRWYCTDTYCGGREIVLGGQQHGQTALENFQRDQRFAQVLVNGQPVWSQDVCGRNPQPAREAFRTADVTDAVRAQGRCEVTLRVEDRAGSGDQPFAIDVFVPQSATDVAMTASGAGVVTFLSKAAKVATKRKAVTKATKAGKGGKASAKAAKRTPTRYEYHHLTPQAFREELRLVAGVDVHDYTMRISRTLHIKLHSKRRMARLGKLDWNSAWKQEMRSGRLTSPEAVDRFVKKMVRDYGLPKNAIVRYPRAPRKQQ